MVQGIKSSEHFLVKMVIFFNDYDILNFLKQTNLVHVGKRFVRMSYGLADNIAISIVHHTIPHKKWQIVVMLLGTVQITWVHISSVGNYDGVLNTKRCQLSGRPSERAMVSIVISIPKPSR